MIATKAELYAGLEEWKEEYTQCIAPTLKERNPRCKNSNGMSIEDKNRFLWNLEKSPQGPRRQREISKFVIYLCCSMTNHRKNVQHNVGGIHSALVARYDPSVERAEVASSKTVEYFVPYTPVGDSPRTVLEELRFARPSPTRLPKNGFVYIFAWPNYPEYVKIGYTGGSVNERIASQDCFRDRKVLSWFEFEYPERIEQLVHRELGKYRYEIMRCEACGKNHTEWFKVSANEATRVLTAWHMLAHTEALYDGPRKLSPAWQVRVSDLKGKLTAHRLLKIIKAEARKAKRASMAMEPPSDTDDLATQLQMLTVDVFGE